MPPRSTRALLAIGAVALGAGCSDGGSTAATTTAVTIAPTTTVRVDDGVFLVGVVTPSIGEGVEIGAAVDAGASLAVREINAAGGVLGQRVQIVRREEGDNPATAELAVQDLVQLGADAIIGPTSSVNLLGSLHHAVDNGVLTCAPTATALALDGFPDSGLLVRTAPSDSLQAEALAAVVEESGTDAALVVYLDDPYGRPLAQAVQAALQRRGTTVADAIGFTTSGDALAAAAATVAAAAPDTVVVLADNVGGPLVIREIEAALDGVRPTFVVNDALRRPAATAPPFSSSVARRIVGVAPLAYADDATFRSGLLEVAPTTTGLYAHHGYDCATLIALAAEAAGSTRPAAVAAAVPAASSGGTNCSTFSVCAAALREGRNVDYDGPTGALGVGADGDPTSAAFERFGFDESGRDTALGVFVVGDD